MRIKDMFYNDIDRKINGVIKVDQDKDEAIEQEISEYVVTKELKKHFTTFFNYYCDSIDNPTDDIGVWISGFFGSGKSHFLKMLSYILSNKVVAGKTVVEHFRSKFEDDPATFMLIDRATSVPTETIPFDIDIVGSADKDRSSVIRVFAKMFYKHLGFFGEDLKVTMLEKYIEKEGKTEEFRRVFEEKKGSSWLANRSYYFFNKKFLIPTLVEVLGMGEEDVKAWLKDNDVANYSIDQLVCDIKEYVDKKPKDFRLVFLIDEVGQYVGTDTDMLLNLQSIVEKVGAECDGKVWIICTGQEAIDEIIKVRTDEFSRIQARFKTYLSLSSSSVDEVIQKRILRKTNDAENKLEAVYSNTNSILRNLFSFSNSVLDIKGFTGPKDFSTNFPFVPYQFIILQKVFSEIRKHGNAGKNMSSGERSMLSGFQEAAQKIEHKDENSIAPFFMFYDTLQTFIDSSIRRVIDRCQRAADNSDGIEQQDVDVLKLLYLIRYVDDIPSNLDNIVILMADNIFIDKINMREKISASLDRLMTQNYIGRTGDTYNFLTDEEQDVQREIKNTPVDTSTIVGKIGEMIFGDIFTSKKYKYGKYDFSFDQMVDDIRIGSATGGMCLKFLTVAYDESNKAELRLMDESRGKALVVLSDADYYESLEKALKIRKYAVQHTTNIPKTVQLIIRNQQEEANNYEKSAKENLIKAIESAEFYVDGEHIQIGSGSAANKINTALDNLVTQTYNQLDLINKNYYSDAEIAEILSGTLMVVPGMEPNADAGVKILEFLEIQKMGKLKTSMADIQSRYSATPYGWKEIDIAAVVAQLIVDKKVIIKYAGETIRTDNPKLVDMLRKKSEIGSAIVSIKNNVNPMKIREVKSILQEYLDIMAVPDDEDELVAFIIDSLTNLKLHYEELLSRYNGKNYPDKDKVLQSIENLNDILLQKKDNIALIDAVINNEDVLFDNKDRTARVEEFFKNQVQIFDLAAKLEDDLRADLSYIKNDAETEDALNQIRLITKVQKDSNTIYKSIPSLNGLIAKVKEGHGALLRKKQNEVLNVITVCKSKIHMSAKDVLDCENVLERADSFYEKKFKEVDSIESIAILEGYPNILWNYMDDTIAVIDAIKTPPVKPQIDPEKPIAPVKKKNVKRVYRQSIFAKKTLTSEADIDTYLERVREQLINTIKDCDEINLD